MRRISAALDYTGPVLGGIASWVHCLLRSDWMVRWLRTNEDYEPDLIG